VVDPGGARYYASTAAGITGPYEREQLRAAFARGGGGGLGEAWAPDVLISRGADEGWHPPQAYPELALPPAQPSTVADHATLDRLVRRSCLGVALGQFLVIPWFVWVYRVRRELDPSEQGRRALVRDLALVFLTGGLYLIAVEYGLAKDAARLAPHLVEPGFPVRFLMLRLGSLPLLPLGMLALYLLQDRLNRLARDVDRELVFGAPLRAPSAARAPAVPA
jgi:hypothetical protein